MPEDLQLIADLTLDCQQVLRGSLLSFYKTSNRKIVVLVERKRALWLLQVATYAPNLRSFTFQNSFEDKADAWREFQRRVEADLNLVAPV